jgi:hypothetical protein
VDTTRVALLQEVLAGTEWIGRTRAFARTLRTSTREPGGLLLVGTPAEEPWHLAAHLGDEARLSGLPALSPTLVRWSPPSDAPPHLSYGLARLEAARRGETLFVVSPDEESPAGLLQRIADARKVGATILSIDAGDADLAALAHDSILVPRGVAVSGVRVPTLFEQEPLVSMDSVQHLVSLAAGERPTSVGAPGRRGFQDRLARFLDAVSGPAPGTR